MFHETIQKLSNMTDHIEFERMMCDLLASLKYKGIEPQSPGLADGGKDAIYYNEQEEVLFAFSLRKDWKKKFNEDFKKASKCGMRFNKFVFCTNRAIPALERDKIKEAKNIDGVQVDFFDQERIRVSLDTDFKKIRQIYLEIQDNSTIRRKIRNILFDAENEVERLDHWKILSMVAPLEMIGLFDLIKDKDLAVICETQEEYGLFKEFIDSFLIVRKLSSEIDNHYFSVIGKNVSSNLTIYWHMVGEYCKLRLLGLNEDTIEKKINIQYPTFSLKNCEKFYNIFQKDKKLKELLQHLGSNLNDCISIFDKIKALKAFEF